LLRHEAGRRPPSKPRVLVLTPTRELAAQVEESVRTYGHFLPLKTALASSVASASTRRSRR
jgi:ATP-dependent RNA helicase RhlE